MLTQCRSSGLTRVPSLEGLLHSVFLTLVLECDIPAWRAAWCPPRLMSRVVILRIFAFCAGSLQLHLMSRHRDMAAACE